MKQYITLGEASKTQTIIRSGLSEGDVIAKESASASGSKSSSGRDSSDSSGAAGSSDSSDGDSGDTSENVTDDDGAGDAAGAADDAVAE